MNPDSDAQAPGNWPFAAAAGVLVAFIAVYFWAALKQNDGHFVYAQDDPYIHLAMARTLVVHGVWGVTPDQFAPASSSPLWTVLLATIRGIGAEAEWWPFAINVAASLMVLRVADRLMPLVAAPAARFLALLTFIVVLPLPTLAFIGMEHTLHIACVIALCGAAAEKLASAGPDRMWPAGAGLALLTAGLRYEGLFVVTAVGAACLLRRRWLTAVSVGVAGAIVPALYAVFALAHGGPALPNSVLMKSDPARFGSWMSALGVLGDWVGVLSLYRRPVVAVLAAVALLLVAVLATPGRSPWSVPIVLIGLFVGVTVLHVCLVKVEWFFRYESYVIAIGLAAVTRGAMEVVRVGELREALARSRLRRQALVACAVVLSLPLVSRGAEAMLLTVPATGEVYRQQYQMGLFFKEFYPGDVVALNDIGAVTWLAPVKVVDLVGLASPDVASARRRNEDDTTFFDKTLQQHGATAACVYEYYFSGSRSLPASWHKVGEWKVAYHAAISGDTVAFYAPSPAEVLRLRESLDQFAARLPTGVTYRKAP